MFQKLEDPVDLRNLSVTYSDTHQYIYRKLMNRMYGNLKLSRLMKTIIKTMTQPRSNDHAECSNISKNVNMH